MVGYLNVMQDYIHKLSLFKAIYADKAGISINLSQG